MTPTRHSLFITLLITACSAPVIAGDNISLDDILAKINSGRVEDSTENAARLAKFKSEVTTQTQLLAEAANQRTQAEKSAAELEARFEENDLKIIDLEHALQERLGSLKELFGVLQQASGDARGQFENSPTQIQFPERSQFLSELAHKMGQTNRLASLEEIRRLWYELQREITESGKVVRFPAKVITAQGEEVEQQVTRIGAFNVVSNGKYLRFDPTTGHLLELARQPAERYLEKITALESATSGATVPFGLDPSRGQILSLLVQTPNLRERIEQGGAVGYVIIALGCLALLIAAERLIALTVIGVKVTAQARNAESPGNNPLGRILQVYHNNPKSDVETLDLKLSEAILKETPKINRLLMFLKIIAVVAPLLGLLGTVTGMIITFQAITLFGTGDPKLMAGGISQALVTTVLGLCVAIPTVLLHTLVSSRARRLNQVLEEQATGLVAAHSEQQHRGTS